MKENQERNRVNNGVKGRKRLDRKLQKREKQNKAGERFGVLNGGCHSGQIKTKSKNPFAKSNLGQIWVIIQILT